MRVLSFDDEDGKMNVPQIFHELHALQVQRCELSHRFQTERGMILDDSECPIIEDLEKKIRGLRDNLAEMTFMEQ